ncbi:hypothetical protein N8J89_39785 [Crossiella sp. CA-258035]|uniref:hypothetical protein n=1 Tax=Crossiella sp. CA-258035 TaxID=2981138 RepID=UPI0024BC515E|nr:hypothetical protein [Crossiella sp. CA-258035]WHT19166.1 hypothetical protein N8J89_39785 [Crossiella sp. CA-258035]
MPEPVLATIAAALASSRHTGLYELVQARFTDDRTATKALVAAEGEAADSRQVRKLTAALAQAEAADPEFGERLRAEWAKASQHAETEGVTNHISGTVTGNVVQARDIHGGVRFTS